MTGRVSISRDAGDTANDGVTAAKRRGRKPRGRGLRATTGCTVCRKRHVKCDEATPTCGPCARRERTCVYGKNTASGTDSNTRSSSADHQRVVASPLLPNAGSHPDPILEEEIGLTPVQPVLWNTFRDDASITSPQSTFSSSAGVPPADVAPLKWLGLLAGDVASQGDLGLSPPIGRFDITNLAQESHIGGHEVALGHGNHANSEVAESLASQLPRLLQSNSTRAVLTDAVPADDEEQFWQAPYPIQMRDHELPIFKRFVNYLSHWIDLFDPLKHFSTFVPHLALRNEGLMKAILALSARHLSLKPSNPHDRSLDRTVAVQYYYETLHYLQNAMKYESYTRSLELNATALIVSSYEMIDGAGNSWERHLKGIFWIQRSQDINGESGGLKQAVWWAWLRQDLWAAFRERRRCFSFFKPKKPYHLMDQYDIASRSVYLLSQSVNYRSDAEVKAGEANLQARIDKADALLQMLEEWRRNLSFHFEHLPLEERAGGLFKPIWINPPGFGVAMQMHQFAHILLLVHRPAAGGFREMLSRERDLNESVDIICGLAITVCEDHASALISTQCLFGAGLYVQGKERRDAILELLGAHQSQTGWPIIDLREELRAEWTKESLR